MVAFSDDENPWSGDGGDEVFSAGDEDEGGARAPGDEVQAAARVAKATRHGVRETKDLGALNCPERRALGGSQNRRRRRRWSPARTQGRVPGGDDEQRRRSHWSARRERGPTRQRNPPNARADEAGPTLAQRWATRGPCAWERGVGPMRFGPVTISGY
uniref:PH01B001G05.5 protein n=1 Tax=Phyllostachys edulis TaxID=38705 RepID=L0P2B6_PHYED|nr:PH01B001G05.5 [Phyllostachys edulis]